MNKPHSHAPEKPAAKSPAQKPLEPQVDQAEPVPEEKPLSLPEACDRFIQFVEKSLANSSYSEAAKLEIANLRKSLAA